MSHGFDLAAPATPPVRLRGSDATTEVLGRAAQPPLLEREAELATLAATFDAVLDGDGRLIVVEGGAGIGKTRLLGEARTLAEEGGFEVVAARGGELEGEFAFGIVRQLFEAPLAVATPKVRSELLAGAAGLTSAVLASTPAATGEVGAPESSFAMLHGLYWLAFNFASRKPTLLLVDDLHWADEPSLRWLMYLARRLEGLPLLLLLGTRPAEQAKRQTLVSELLATPGAIALHPGVLGQPSVTQLALVRFGVDPDPAFAAALRTGSGGNPLYLAALLDELWRGGVEPNAESAPRVQEIGPRAVGRGVAARLAHLPPGAADLLRAASILGDRSDLALAASFAELSGQEALEAASALVTADLLRSANPLEFIHPVVRSAVLEAMSPAQRISAHRRAAETLLEAGAVPERAATHLLLTVPDQDAFVVAALRTAATRALKQGVPETAVSYLSRALEEPPLPEDHVDVLYELGDAELNVAPADGSTHLSEAVERLDDPMLRPDIVLAYERSATLLGRNRDAGTDLLFEISDSARELDPDLHWRLEGRLIISSQFEPELGQLVAKRVDAIDPRNVGSGVGAGVLLAAWAMVETRRGLSREDAITYAERALASEAFEASDERLNIVNALVALSHAGEMAQAAQAYEPLIASMRKQGDLLSLAAFQLFRGHLRSQSGDLLGAEEDLRPLDRSAFHESPDFKAYRAAYLAEVMVERGELEEARHLVDQPTPANAGFRLRLLEASGRVRLALDQPKQALAHLLEAARITDAAAIENPAVIAWRSQAALALHRLGREDEARELANEELALARRWGAPRTVGVSLRALGLLEGGSTGEQLLRDAVETLAPSPARLEHARALVDLGAALRRRNSRSEARQLLRDGVDQAHRCGAAALVVRANHELAATGAHPRTVMLSGLDALTASERRVAQMAAADLSNKEIAQALFVTVKTVESHLGRVYRKLAVGSRKELSAALGAPVELPVAP